MTFYVFLWNVYGHFKKHLRPDTQYSLRGPMRQWHDSAHATWPFSYLMLGTVRKIKCTTFEPICLLLQGWKLPLRLLWTWIAKSDCTYQISILSRYICHQSCFRVSTTNVDIFSTKWCLKINDFVVFPFKHGQNIRLLEKPNYSSSIFAFWEVIFSRFSSLDCLFS